ncbi:MAG: hypothetical protein ACP5GZ_02935 [Vulcanisaeta sp.]|jgi:DNA-directed RNA polymerase subunit RPC12/RpoP|uniref:hypothetical protein n=1 Tax=Vulcanisaeta sp. TaxID=2020871 RepID=UPI002357050E
MSTAAKALTKVVVCPLCDYMGEDVNKVVDAITKAIPRPKLKCPKCGAEVDANSFVTHMRKHGRVGGKTITCEICGAKLNGEGTFLRHIKEHLIVSVRRNGMDVYYCLVCGQEFITKNSAITHLIKRHSLE